jgi:transcriptional regulator with XRE-family HTH domain
MLHLPRKRKIGRQRHESLANLRKIIGLTQKGFARLIGVSIDLIKGIESGRNRLSVGLAQKIYMATGADAGSLMQNNGRSSYLGEGEDYDRRHFDHWRKSIFPSNEATAWESFEKIICPHMLLVLLAASRPAVGGKIKGRLTSLLQNWAAWEREVVEAFGLEPQIKDILRQFPVTQSKTMTWGEWRMLVKHEEDVVKDWCKKNPGKPHSMAKTFNKHWWGFRDNLHKKDNEMLTLKSTVQHGFWPGLFGMPDIVKLLEEKRFRPVP